MSTESVPLLDVQGVAMEFGGLRALEDVSFTLSEGDILGIIGPNGAGKTTLLDVISGHLSPTSGEVFFQGISIKRKRPHETARRGLARSFQDTQAFPSLTVRETLIAGALHRCKTAAGARKEADRVIDALGLGVKAHTTQGNLSLPDRKLVELGKCMVMRPNLMLLDEVMAGLTMAECEGPLELIQELRQRDGMSFVLIEHVMPVILRIASRLIVLDFGRILLEGEPQDVVSDERVRASYLGGKK